MTTNWPTIAEVQAMSEEQANELRLTLLAELNDDDKPDMVGPFRRYEDEVPLFVYLEQVGIVYDGDQGRFFLIEE